MSEDVSAVVDETPPPDIVEHPARSRGAYKLCMQCGQNVLRFEYRAGSSICKRCEGQGSPSGLVEEAGAVADADDEAAAWASEEQAAAVVPPTSVPGALEAAQWLAAACGVRRLEDLTLEVVAAKLGSVLEQQTQMIGRVTRYGVGSGAPRPEEVPLEVAAQALWLACDPLVQERLTAACEVLRLSLNQVILGNLAYHEQDLLDQDQSLVPQASYAAQYGSGVGRRSVATGRTGLPGGPLVDADGRLVKDCQCCGRTFHPPAQRPNPDFCDEGCGTFVDQLRIWATNSVLNDLRYPGQVAEAPLPDPRTYWPMERCQEPFLTHALQFRAQRLEVQMAQAREQQQKMRGL